MQFTATKVVPDAGIENHVPVGVVECPMCSGKYVLFAPILETEEAEVNAQREWLSTYLKKNCPNHPDLIRTPDRPR